MKHYLIVLTVCLFMQTLKSQAIFCPQGAEWSYNFGLQGPKGTCTLEKIAYVRDSVIGPDQVKVLKHSRFTLECNTNTPLTVIKQKGDTVFMRNALTNDSWEILYNFNVTSGQSWQTSLLNLTYTITVDSVNYVNVNGFNLKRLYTQYNRSDAGNQKHYSCVITERFGTNTFLFAYSTETKDHFCDADWFLRYLCYKDASFGAKQFTTYDCDYQQGFTSGLQKITTPLVSIYPVPSSGFLTLEYSNNFSGKAQGFDVLSITGQHVLTAYPCDAAATEIRLDIQSLDKGLYFLKVPTTNGSYLLTKFIRN